jgi:hypothetical protein
MFLASMPVARDITEYAKGLLVAEAGIQQSP